jgi:hypothetical protein
VDDWDEIFKGPHWNLLANGEWATANFKPWYHRHFTAKKHRPRWFLAKTRCACCILYWLTLLLFAVWNSELKWTAEKTLCEKYFFLPRQNRQFWCNASFLNIIWHWKKMFLAVIVITNSYINYSWKNWIGIIFHLFTTVCKYGVSTLQYTLQNMVEIPSKFPMDF